MFHQTYEDELHNEDALQLKREDFFIKKLKASQ